MLDDQIREERTVVALQPQHRQASTKVRAFVDFLAERFALRSQIDANVRR